MADSCVVAARLAARCSQWADAAELGEAATALLARLGVRLYPVDDQLLRAVLSSMRPTRSTRPSWPPRGRWARGAEVGELAQRVDAALAAFEA